jgi:serine/threonine protein kinase
MRSGATAARGAVSSPPLRAMRPIPQSIGDFRILKPIGSGGMAEVFLAEKSGAQGTSKRIVVKRILPALAQDARLFAMLVREARLATGLDHPNVVHVHELVDHPADGLLLAMEFVDGADLATVLRSLVRRGERCPPYVAALIAREVAKGLHYAHSRTGEDGEPLEIVHRDVSPQNILLSRDGVVKVTDLGVATARLYRDATTGVKGKLRYMAPEQAAGERLDARADVYALGVVLYEMLRLVSPYGARTGAALLRAVREGKLDPPLDRITDVPADLLAVLRRALAHAPEDRYPTARDLADDLSRALLAQQRVIDETAVEALVRSVLDAPEPADAAPAASATPTVPAVPASIRKPAPPASRALLPGAKVGRYVIDRVLGRGGMADVYAARDTTLDREVALKVLRDTQTDAARYRLLREAKLAARFEHPGSVVIYDVGEADGVGFIAMELVRGVPLSRLVGDAEVPIARRVRWMVSVARVVAAAHAAGLVHRDIKPTNLMIREGGEVKVLDFGIARAFAAPRPMGEPSSSGGSFLGTLRYAAPEQLAGGAVDGRADQFSWGITAWELFAGRHPFEDGDAIEAAARIMREGIGPLAAAAPDVPAEVARAVDRALAMRPADRFPSLDEAADALEPFAETPPARAAMRSIPDDGGEALRAAARTSMVPPEPAAAPRPARRFSVFAAAVAGVAALVAAGLVVGLPRDARAPSNPVPAAPAPVVDAVGCTDAVVDGDAGADLARALGRGACARLAPELGVDWAVPGATHRLEVRATVRPDRSVVTLRIAGREATGSGEAPMPAVWSAIAALAPQLASPPWPPERVRLWGARDEASARRIFRVWRHASIRVLPTGTAEIMRLMETDGDSPIPHLLALMNDVGGRELGTVRRRILDRLDRLPAARADSIRGQILAFPAEVDRKGAARLMRAAHAAGPDDHAMTALYAGLSARMGLPEAHAVLERLHQEAPTYSVGALENALSRAAYRDEARAEKYLGWLRDVLPESAWRLGSVQRLAGTGRLADARAALDLGRRLGLDRAPTDPLHFTDASVQIDLAALSPAAARERSALLLGDPRFLGLTRGGLAVVASYLLEGRFAEAARATRDNVVRARDEGNAEAVWKLSLGALRRARWLGAAPDPLCVTALDAALVQSDDIPPHERVEAEAELALVRGDKAVAGALARIEAEAARDPEDRLIGARALVSALALARAARGDRAAAARWTQTEEAPFVARRAAALDAALALEAAGDARAAEVAYGLAADPVNNVEDAAERVLALARLALLRRKQGRAAADDGARLDALWAGADAGLREAVARMR